jgi:glycosyltransferase involved in cell wall biosynthesis
MRVLSLSMVYPNSRQPNHGVFVRQRLLHVAAHADVTVVAPIPYFPLATGHMENRPAGVEARRTDGPLQVRHPRFWSVPGLAKGLDGYLYAASIRRLVHRLHRQSPFDLIDAHFAFPDGFAGVQLGRGLGIPVSITLRGTLPDLMRRPSRRAALRHALMSADAILSVSEGLREDARRLGVPGDRIAVVPNGIDTAQFARTSRPAARAALGLPLTRRLVLTVGALREVKGHHHLLAAIARLRDQVPDVLAIIVGGSSVSDDRSAQLRAMAANLGIEGHVFWAGARPHAEIPTWLSAADVFVNTSRREGCCNALLEAQSCGLPSVATAVGGNPEIINRPELGELVPAADPVALAGALERVLAQRWDPDEIRDAVAGRSWDAVGRTVIETWRQQLRQRRGATIPAQQGRRYTNA